MENLKQVSSERSHFLWNSIPLVFQSCLSNVFHASYVFQDVLLLMPLFLISKKTPFFPFIPSSSSCCGTDTKRNSGGR